MIEYWKAKHLRLYFTALTSCALVSCGGAPESRSKPGSDQQDPPGAAQALSLGAEVASGANELEVAIKCAAALRITSTTLSSLSSQANSDVLSGVRRAAGIFERRAREAQGGRSAVRAITRLELEKAEDRGGQARTAIGCIRRLEDGTVSRPPVIDSRSEEG